MDLEQVHPARSVAAMSTPRELATTYFDAWTRKDFDTLRGVLADDATLRGPVVTADDADECIAGLTGMSQMMTGVDVQAMIVEGQDVMTWFELRTTDAPPLPTVNWSHVEDGRISRIRVTFDPRPLFEAGE